MATLDRQDPEYLYVAMGPRETAAGALAVLAYVSWLRGQGTQSDERLALAKACVPCHAHGRAVSAMIRATSVAVVAGDLDLSWKPVKG